MFGEFFKRKEDRFVTLTPKVEEVVEANAATDRARWETCVNAFDVSASLVTTLGQEN